MAIEEGKAGPAFTLPDQDGRKVSLSGFKGKQAVVIYFYPKDDTPGCTKEACGFRDLNRELAKLGVAVLGVSADSPETHRKFIAKYKLNFPLLSDEDRKVMTAYGAYGEKMLYGRKTVGVIRSTALVGRNGKVLRHWARVASAEKHPAQVIAAIRELGEG